MISVIIVTYNSINVLPDCIMSLEESSIASELEIVIVDNASNDNTCSWVQAYEQRHKLFRGFRLLRLETNLGYAYANNRGIEKALGEIILLLNPDTIVAKDAIEICARRLRSDSIIGAVGCRLKLADGRLDRACRRSFPTLWNSLCRFTYLSCVFPKYRIFARYNLTYLNDSGSYEVDCLSGAFLMICRTLLQNIKGLDEDYFMYGEDIELCYRIRESGLKVWYEGTVQAIHLKGGNGGKKSVQSLKHFYYSMYIYCRKKPAMFSPIELIIVYIATRIAFKLHAVKILLKLRSVGR